MEVINKKESLVTLAKKVLRNARKRDLANKITYKTYKNDKAKMIDLQELADFLKIKRNTLANYYWKKKNLPKRTFISTKKAFITHEDWNEWQNNLLKDNEL